jgi:hypothetical protein
MSTMRLTCAIGSALLVASVAGCFSTGSQSNRSSPFPLVGTGAEPDTAIIQYVIVERTFGTDEINRRVWDRVDEQVLPYEIRSVHEAAGLRVGIANETAPGVLRKLIDDPRTAWGHRARTFALDRPAPLTVTGNLDRAEFAAPAANGGRTKFARTNVVLGFEMTVRRASEGKVLVKLVPRARYQDPSQILPTDIADRGLGTDTFPAAGFEIALSTSAYLVVGTDSYWEGTFGHAAFTERTEDRRVQRLLVIRAGRSGSEPGAIDRDDPEPPPIAAQAGTVRGMRP